MQGGWSDQREYIEQITPSCFEGRHILTRGQQQAGDFSQYGQEVAGATRDGGAPVPQAGVWAWDLGTL